MKLVLILAMAVFAISTEDLSTAGFDKLSETQKADLVKFVAQKAVSDSGAATVELADKWANFGIKIGKALSSCAKEINVAVNDFLKTPAGKLTFVMIAWKVMATDLIHVFGALTMLIIGWVIFSKFYRMWTIKDTKLNYERLDIFRRPTKEIVKREIGDGEAAALWGIGFGFVLCFAIALFTI